MVNCVEFFVKELVFENLKDVKSIVIEFVVLYWRIGRDIVFVMVSCEY